MRLVIEEIDDDVFQQVVMGYYDWINIRTMILNAQETADDIYAILKKWGYIKI